MDHLLGIMNVSQTFYELLEEVAGHILFQSTALLDIREQVTSRAKLNNKADMLFRLKGIK